MASNTFCVSAIKFLLFSSMSSLGSNLSQLHASNKTEVILRDAISSKGPIYFDQSIELNFEIFAYFHLLKLEK